MQLCEWLDWLENKSSITEIKLGLERSQSVAHSLNLLELSQATKVITIAGTNGKGSTVACLEKLLLSHGKTVGTYTSPHLVQFNERIKINGEMVSDEQIVDAFCLIKTSPMSKDLTYYEWVTLSALSIFKNASLDYILLEVGLGGRLDAVNIIDANVAIITSIDFDHTEFLGTDLESIAFEKSGIYRENQMVFCGEPRPPSVLMQRAKSLNISFYQIEKDYTASVNESDWRFVSSTVRLNHLPLPTLHINNVTTALACFLSLEIPTSEAKIVSSLSSLCLAGRCQKIGGIKPLLLDVAHNSQSIKQLCEVLASMDQRCIIVFSMLQGKPIDVVIEQLAPFVETWFIAPLNSPRSYSKESLEIFFRKLKNVESFSSIELALKQAAKQQREHQTLVVCGSFITVSAALTL
jgi:dihydrofolate synthase / folylpolyglutamate synthase